MRVPLPLTLLAVIALAAACGGATPTATTTTVPTTGATSTPAGTVAGTATPAATTAGSEISCNNGLVGSEVSIVDFAFEPATIAADADLTVNWKNNGATGHTVTFDSGPDCGTLASGESLTVLFPAGAGSYPYHCDIHPAMTGTVTVNG